ncbi:MAG: EamA family transporter [Actinomycetota bacterium]
MTGDPTTGPATKRTPGRVRNLAGARTGGGTTGGVAAGNQPSRRSVGVALAFFGMLVISTDSLITRAADAGGWTVAFWYGVFTTPAMVAYLFATERGRPMAAIRRSGPMVLASGLLQMASTTAFILAIKNTSVANVVVIIAAAPLVTAVLAWLLLGERTSRRAWVAIGVAMVGILLVVSGSIGGGGLTGDLLAVLAIASFGLNLTIWRNRPEMSRTLVMAIAGAASALVTAPLADIFGHRTQTYLLLALMGLVFGPLGRIALASATRYLPAAEVSLFTPIETVAASIWAWLFFQEVPADRTLVGGAVILAAVLFGTTGSADEAG